MRRILPSPYLVPKSRLLRTDGLALAEGTQHFSVHPKRFGFGSRSFISLTGIFAIRNILSVHQTFAALGDRNRTRIVELLLQGERPVGEVAKKLRLSQPNASKHLKTLKDVGLLSVRSDAQSRLYSLRPAALRSLDAWLTPYRKLWADRLDALEKHLDTMPEGSSLKGSSSLKGKRR